MNGNEHSKYRRLPVDKLPPAAARLLLASFTMGPGDTYADLMERSGIYNCRTFLAARRVLLERGFIRQHAGQEHTTLYEQEPERKPLATIPYIGVIRTTDAKQ